MSVDKLLSQADKLLDKGKPAEAIAKLQEAFALDANNELVANKLARAFVDQKRPHDAVAIYKQQGVRAASSGKAQKAYALFKQGLDIDPQNLELLERIAPECESIGKLSEAGIYAQKVLAYYVPRKRYLDALNSFALIAKVQPNEESIRLAWVELLMYARNEMQLRKALVCFCGPPGLHLNEFPVGGDPTKLSARLFDALMGLVPFYIGEPMLPYALAWIAYRQGKEKDAVRLLLDCFAKDQNFTLAVLLFARMLADKQRLEESLYVYQYAKDRMGLDRSVDQKALQQQIQAFEEKNGWMTFADGVGANSDMSPQHFLSKFIKQHDEDEERADEDSGSDSSVPDLFGSGAKNTVADYKRSSAHSEEYVPQEVDLGAIEPEAEASVVIQFSGEPTMMLRDMKKEREEKNQQERIVERVVERIVERDAAPQRDLQEQKNEIFVGDDELEEPKRESARAQYTAEDLIPTPEPEPAPVEAAPEELAPKEEGTKLFSPIDLLDAQKQQQLYKKPKYRKASIAPVESLPESTEREATQIFSATALRNAAAGGGDTQALVASAKETLPQAAPTTHADESADLGDDLLQETTKMISSDVSSEEDSPSNEAEEVKVSDSDDMMDPNGLLQKAEEQAAKKNWSLAKKILRAAARSGASAKLVGRRMEEWRKLSDPLFPAESVDQVDERPVEQIFNELASEVGLTGDSGEVEQIEDAVAKIRGKIDIALAESDPRVRLDLGVAFLEMGLAREASVQFKRASELDPALKSESAYLLAQSLLILKNYPDAISLLKELTSDPHSPDKNKLPALYLLGEVYSEMKQPKKAKRYFEKVADVDANYRSIREKLGRA